MKIKKYKTPKRVVKIAKGVDYGSADYTRKVLVAKLTDGNYTVLDVKYN